MRARDPHERERTSIVRASTFVGVLAALFAGSACPDVSLPPGTPVACTASADCFGDGAICFRGRCVAKGTACVNADGTAAQNGNACTIAGGAAGICIDGACAAPRCGDGVISPGETCDGDRPDCRADCTYCGDGSIDAADGEVCDNGAANADAVAGACRTTCQPARCGDAVRDPGEECDDGALNSDTAPNACRTTCKRASCGDGVKDDGEACDGEVNCIHQCGKLAVCGDGEVDVEVGEQCDDENDNPSDGCDQCHTQSWTRAVIVSGNVQGAIASAEALEVTAVALDLFGRIYVAGFTTERVMRIDVDGTMTVLAGTGVPGFSGDGGPAASAELKGPEDVAVDAAGNVYIADAFNGRIRRVRTDGNIETVAGGGTSFVEGAAATQVKLGNPLGVFVDGAGRITFSDARLASVLRVELDGTIHTLAGNGTPGFSGDGLPATQARLNLPQGLVVDAAGRTFIADSANSRVRVVGTDGIIDTFAGDGSHGAPLADDGSPATSARIGDPEDVALDAIGRLVVADKVGGVVRRIELDGTISTVAGTTIGFSGDGGPATSAQLSQPGSVAVDGQGAIFIADDFNNNRVRRVTPAGIIDTVAGNGQKTFDGDGGPAGSAVLRSINAVAVDDAGNIFVGGSTSLGVIRPDGTYHLIDSDPSTFVNGLATFGSVLFEADSSNDVITRVDIDGTKTTIAGNANGQFVTSGDEGPALDATFASLGAIAVDASGQIFVIDANRVRRIDTAGVIHAFAGDDNAAFSGDGGPAVDAELDVPKALACTSDGAVLIADSVDNHVRRVDAGGIIETFAGNGLGTGGVDGDLAVNEPVGAPIGLAVDGSGVVYIAETSQRVRSVDTSGVIETMTVTLPVNNFPPDSGDGGPAIDAVVLPSGPLAIRGNQLLIPDVDVGRPVVRSIDLASGIITTIFGEDPPGPGPYDRAQLLGPRDFANLGGGTALVVGSAGRVMRLVDATAPATGGVVDIVVGYDNGGALDRARFSRLLSSAKGIAFDAATSQLYLAEQNPPNLRVVDVAGTDPAAWPIADVGIAPGALVGPAGIALEDSGHLLVADEQASCVEEVDLATGAVSPFAGRCGVIGFFEDPTGITPASDAVFAGPTHVTIGAGVVYIADTGNHRVRVVTLDSAGRPNTIHTVLGDGSPSSSGDGEARLSPVNGPQQMAVDSHGNLFVTSTNAVRLVTNPAGPADADGNATTIYGAPPRDSFPESASVCLSGLMVVDDDHVRVTDACQGFVVELTRAVSP